MKPIFKQYYILIISAILFVIGGTKFGHNFKIIPNESIVIENTFQAKAYKFLQKKSFDDSFKINHKSFGNRFEKHSKAELTEAEFEIEHNLSVEKGLATPFKFNSYYIDTIDYSFLSKIGNISFFTSFYSSFNVLYIIFRSLRL